jgi:hypothetical protein
VALWGIRMNAMGSHRISLKVRPWLAISAILVCSAFLLHQQNRIWWCACGHFNMWDGDIWSAHNSQHVFDPYSFTHVLHGMIFCGLCAWLWPRVVLIWSLTLTIAVEALWEILENSPFIIHRYREATIGLGYEGDSIVNSMADILCCVIGFMLARKLGLRRSVVIFVLTELVLLVSVRDNLTLNVLMLTHPVEAIKAWQMIH